MRILYDEKLAQAAYLVGCPGSGEAILFDPLRDVDQPIALAAEHGLEIVAVAETHIHADFVSGARELAARTGAHVYVSGEGGEDWNSRWLDRGDYAHTRLHHGDTFEIGGVAFEVLHTPGHTPEHIVYLVTDRGSDATAPIGLVSGDFLFVGDLGRPDLLETAAGQAGLMEPSARALFRSLDRLKGLPEFLQVWPGHGAGSACGKAMGAVPTSTIGYERRFNPALLVATSEQAFVDFILEGQPEPPMYFASMKRVNRDGPRVLGGLPQPARLTPAEAARLDPARVAIVDTRPWEKFRAGHLPGSLSFPIQQSFSTDAGSMIREDEPICLVIDPDGLETAIRDLIRIGLDRIESWCPADEVDDAGPLALATIKEIAVEEVPAWREKGGVVLDVRRKGEFDEGRIPGAANIAHTRLMGRLDEVPTGDPLLVNCKSGKRSARSSAYLQRMGREVVNIRGGFEAWQASGQSIEH